MATKKLFVTRKPYNPAAYAPGGSSSRVAGAIQNQGFAAPAAAAAATGGAFHVAPLANPYAATIANAKANLYTPQQLRNIANQQTSAQINTALGQSNASSQAEQAQYAALASRAAGLANALGSWGAQYGANDAAAFNQAANTIGQLGTGLTGAAAADWQGEQTASQQAVAQTLGGQGQVSGYDPSQLRSAAQYTGVTAPGTSLAQQALNAKTLGEFGAVADLANVKSVSDNFIAQASQALQQRAAERASIIAQRPELFQQALQAQRQDNIQTQNHIDDMVSASANWLQNQRQLKDTEAAQKFSETQLTPAQKATLAQTKYAQTHMTPYEQAQVAAQKWGEKNLTPAQKATLAETKRQDDRSYELSRAGLYKTDAQGNPLPGYVKVTGKDGQTAIVDWGTAEQAKQFGLTFNEHAKEFKTTSDINRTIANARLAAAKASGAKVAPYNEALSKQVKYLVDNNRQPILDSKGQRIPYTAPKKAGKPMDTVTQLKVQGTIATYADSLAKGATDPKTGQQTQKPVDLKTALSLMQARGYFDNPRIKNWALSALQSSYGVTMDDIVATAQGIDITTGGAAGAQGITGSQPGDYGPAAPPQIQQAQTQSQWAKFRRNIKQAYGYDVGAMPDTPEGRQAVLDAVGKRIVQPGIRRGGS